jgi:steroid 5-alpha reductase family enzyme
MSPKRPGQSKPFQPAIGADLTKEIQLTKAKTEHQTSRARNNLAYIFVLLIVIAVAIAFLLSVQKNDFSYLGVVWGVAGPVAGAIVGFYFRPHRKD